MAKQTQRAAPRTTTDPAGFAPKTPLAGAERGQKPPVFGERTRMFLLASHATSWDLVETADGWRLVPTLKRLILQAGVNWTKQAKKGATLDPSDLEAKARSRFGMGVLTDVDAYLYGVPGAGGSQGHFLLWENVKVYSDGLWEITFDQRGYDAWRWSLVVDGKVAPPRDSVVSQVRGRLVRARARATRTPHLEAAKIATANAERKLAGLQEALRAIHASSSPERAPAAEEPSGRAA